MPASNRRVVFITPVITHYRLKFHELMRVHLNAAGVRYDIVCGVPDAHEAAKGDLVTPDWVKTIPQKRLHLGGAMLSYHPVFSAIRSADLVIIMQENKHLQNYVLQLLPGWLRPRLGIMGHGRNFQARNPDRVGERWKRIWAKKVDWWFGYTEETRQHVESLGFPKEKITVFNNSVDTSRMRGLVDAVTPERLAERRAELDLVGAHVGVFVGGIYPDKRMQFLIDAADRIRSRIADFELIVVGGGSDLPLVRQLAETRPWLKVMGPRFDRDKVELMLLGQIFMMPGLMGLAILDAGVAGLPVATTAFPWHSPEIAYLDPGQNGVMVQAWEDPAAYADAVAALLTDPARLAAMGEAVRAMAARYSIEAMAENFARGILAALAA